jgi:PIN domain nuclease of toxin-antitoxin system
LLSSPARGIINRSDILVSVASLWELLVKKSKKDALVEDPLGWWVDFVSKAGLPVLGIQESHVAALDRLPAIHRDPFDRILAAQSIVEQAPLISMDRQLSRYGIQILW